MLPKLFFFICYTLCYILTTKCFVSCTITPKTYCKYLSGVMDHISEQVGWDFMQHLEIKYSTGVSFNIKDVVYKGSRIILTKKFDAMIDILNYLYAEVIKTFIDHIRTIANQCQEYYDFNQGDNLLHCTVLLQSVVENSKTMFKQLYNVMDYLSNIDFKLLANAKKTFSVPIVDEIYTFVEYVSLKSQQNTQIFIDPNDSNTKKDACKVILDVKSFIEGIGHETYQNIKEKNISVVYNHKPKCLLEKNLKDYKAQQNKNLELSYYLSEWLNIYYAEISTNLYKNLGFKQVLEDSIKEGTFKPPVHIHGNISQKHVIEQLNTITKENGWKSLKHMNIVFNDQVISVDRILRHPADKLNFHCKKQHILRLIKCNYTEILLEYWEYVIFMLNFCETGIVKSNDVIYLNFVRQIFDTVHKITNMFDIMYKTLISLNNLIGEYFHDNCHSNLKCLCTLITKLLEEIKSGNYSLDVLNSKSNISEQKITLSYARTCVEKFSQFLKYNKSKNSLNVTHDKQCLIQSVLLYNETPLLININNFSSHCKQLIVFAKKFLKMYYEDLGLNKFN
ncbi:uncharacterized protein LOC126894730 [Daktulosphaira vitifoliae]|uniref:uncharacterized protein LOC126894730 n=1 Tax=Daktulosphaira vitifoliae TaxID=58002 RepID=UPI0021AA3688|nr:uncharacterized protein LOC126894730 [Daktulosphaira vitifoliae]